MTHSRLCSSAIAAIALALAVVPVEARQAAADADCPRPDEATATAIVRGRVLDEKTRVPLREAPVELRWLEGPDMKTQRLKAETGAGGAFTFCAAPAGQQLFVNAKYGNADRTTNGFELAPGGETAIEVQVNAAHLTLTGQVVEFESGAPIASATVRLRGTPLQAFTQADGRFAIQELPAGPYDVDIEHVSYRTVRDSFALDLGTNVSLTVRMATNVIPLEPLIVTVRSQHLERTGFYERRERGHGTYITRDEIERSLPSYSTDILRKIAGVSLVRRRYGPGYGVVGRGNCPFRYVVDGARIGPDYSIDDMPPQWIEALEVYRGPSSLPHEFTNLSADVSSNCGVIVIWTRNRD
jgi:hypothetical protein